MAADSQDRSSCTPASLFKCCVCTELYSENEHAPLLLKNCGHTLCEQCLRRLGKQTGNFKFEVICPACLAPTRLGDADQFPRHIVLLSYIQSSCTPQTSDPTQLCDRCSTKPAEFGCSACKVKLCSGCWAKVHSFGPFLSHEKGVLSAACQIQQCCRHQEKLNYVCVDPNCPEIGDLMCILCKDTLPHKDHQSEVLVQVLDDKRRQLKNAINQIQEGIVFAGRALACVNDTDGQLQGNGDQIASKPEAVNSRDTAIRQIEDHFDQLIWQMAAQLRERKAALIEQVRELVHAKASRLGEQRAELSEFLHKSYSTLELVTKAMNTSSPRGFLASYRSLQERMENVLNTRLHADPVVTSQVSVSLSGNLFDAVRAHGEVRSDGELSQARRLPHAAALPGDSVKSAVPAAVQSVLGDGVQLHSVRWDPAKCHRGLQVSSGGAVVRQNASSYEWKNCLGATEGFVSGLHYFSVRVFAPAHRYLLVGFCEGKLSTEESAGPGFGAHNQDLGAAVRLSDGNVYFLFNGSGKNVPCAKGGERVCSVGVLLDLNANKASFFIDGKNALDNGPLPDFSVPAGKKWLPFVCLHDVGTTITSETFD